MSPTLMSCHSPAKHPRAKHGCKDASIDAAQLQAWWHRWPNANLGLASSPHSGLWVLDCEQPNQLQALQQKLRIKLLPTLTARTARGLPLYRKWAVGIRTRSTIFPGLEVRREGGYVVAPPSLHISGDYSSWLIQSKPTLRLRDTLRLSKGSLRQVIP
jgi:putative DNA primase/helicase